MDFKKMLHKELIDLMIEGGQVEEVFGTVASHLKKLNFVNEGYNAGILIREQKFPTGLITQYLNIGLPHSDPEYVEQPFIFIARLKRPITMKQMGDSQEMSVSNLFFLGIKEPTEQVGLLQAFMNLFMDENFVTQFVSLTKPEDIYQLFVEHI
ncbi:hypothetical protein IGI37_002924 [Enterococcus sp. AZ194]|uniref:PTS sugar transporter subunit IIA n=1 Tax=Enterococcus sp. AZ194 TaxID=2774629 RepID=UPI003F24BC2A